MPTPCVHCQPARADGRLASPCRWHAAVSSGTFQADKAYLQRPDLLAGRTPRTINMVTIGDDLQRPASPAFGPAIEAVVVYNSKPGGGGARVGAGRAGFAREDLFTVVLEHFQTDTADYADYILPATTQLEHWDIHLSYGHTDVLLNQPAIAPLGESKPNAQIFRELALRMGFLEPCFQEDDASMCRKSLCGPGQFRAAAATRFRASEVARCPVCTRWIPHAIGALRAGQRTPGDAASTRCQTMYPTTRRWEHPERYPLAMISPPARNFSTPVS